MISGILTNMGIVFIREYRLLELEMKRFDFYFKLGDDEFIIIEYDGKQHFEMITFYHKTSEGFRDKRCIDIFKHLVALISKVRHKVIRIDYTVVKFETDFTNHILAGLKSPDHSYYSTPKLYQWMIVAEEEFITRSRGLSHEEEIALCHEISRSIAYDLPDMFDLVG